MTWSLISWYNLKNYLVIEAISLTCNRTATDVWTLRAHHVTAGELFLGFLVHHLWICLCVCDQEIKHSFSFILPSLSVLFFLPHTFYNMLFLNFKRIKGNFLPENGDIFNTTVVPRGYIHYCKRRWGSVLARDSFWTWAGISGVSFDLQP